MPEYLVTATYRVDAYDDRTAAAMVLDHYCDPNHIEVALIDDPAEAGTDE